MRAKADLHAEQRRNRMELAYIQKRLQFLTLLKAHSGNLAEDKELQLKELQQKEKVLLNEHKLITDRESSMTEEGQESPEMNEVESIRIHDTIFPEVAIGVGDLGLTNVKERTNIMFFRVGESMKMGPLSAAMKKT